MSFQEVKSKILAILMEILCYWNVEALECKIIISKFYFSFLNI